MVTNRSTSTAGIVLVDVDLLAIGEYYFWVFVQKAVLQKKVVNLVCISFSFYLSLSLW